MRMKFNSLNRPAALMAFCLLFIQHAWAQPPAASTQSTQQVAAKVDEYMNAAMTVDGFSGSILVAREGQPIISKGYGMANYELDVPNTPQTVFRLGSITKQFTATAIMMLKERGKLSVNDPICKHLSDCPATWQPITIRNLLTHTSGIPNYQSFPEAVKLMTLPVTHAELIGRFRDKPLEFAPGVRFNYGSSNYYLLGVIIERASGVSYEDFLQANIFKPLGMTSTGYDHGRRVIKNRAAGYVVLDGSLANAPYYDMTIPFAGGALVSTTEDLLLWDKALYTERLVSRRSLDEMHTPFKAEYGYGWDIGKMFDRRVISHTGSIFGFRAKIERFPSDGVTVIVLSNKANAPAARVADDLSAIIFGMPYKLPQERKAIAMASETLEKYVGQYQLAPNIIMTITNENGKLIAQATGQSKNELFAESETIFFLKTLNAQITFIKDTQERVTGLVLRQGRNTTPAEKIK